MKYSIIFGCIVLISAGIWFSIQHTQKEKYTEMAIHYVREHISELSPEKSVLGGTFFVTRITADNGEGIVEYEDGHVAYTASFTYTTKKNLEITSFTIRE